MPFFYHKLDAWPSAGTSAPAQALADRMAGAYLAFAKTPGAGVLPPETPARNAPVPATYRTQQFAKAGVRSSTSSTLEPGEMGPHASLRPAPGPTGRATS